MGKRPGRTAWGSKTWDQGSYSYTDASWQFWPGAWSPQDKTKDSWMPTSRPAFPAYDDQARVQALAKALPSAKGKGKYPAPEPASLVGTAGPAESITQILQESINATRKQEQRVRSLAATKARKAALWEHYVADMKQTLQKEHARHQKEMDRVETELQSATQAQDQARAHLRRSWEAIAQGATATAAPMDTEGPAWDTMLAAWQEEQQEVVASRSVLRRALGTLMAADDMSAGPAHVDELFQTPPRRIQAAPPLTPPSMASAAATPPGLSRTTDPYMTSPGQPVLPEARPIEVEAEQAENVRMEQALKARPRSTEPRAPIKKLPAGVQHPNAPPHSDLAEKLHQKRASQIAHMSGGAMHPFRQPPQAPLPASGHDPPPNVLSSFAEVDSEDDMLLPPPAGSALWVGALLVAHQETRSFFEQKARLTVSMVPGEPVDGAILRSFRMDPASVVTCTFPTEGEISSHIAIYDLLASDPGAFGPVRGDNVRLQGNTTLLFFAEEAESDASSSDTHEHLPPQLPFAALSVADEDDNVPAAEASAVWGTDTLGGRFAAAPHAPATEPSIPSHARGSADLPDVPEIAPPAEIAHMSPWQVELSYYGLHLQPPNEFGEVYAVFSEPDHSVVPVVAYVYAPDFTPVRITLPLTLPCSVSEALDAAKEARRGDVNTHFPCLHTVTPQPFADMLVFVASPPWLTSRVPVFFDCRRFDGTLFACFVHPRLRVGSLLLAAGVSSTSAFDVYAHGLIRPLPVDQLVDLVPGMLLTLVPSGCGAPATSDLASRLLSVDGWDSTAHIPPPHGAAHLHYLVLTEGMPRLYAADPTRASLFYEELARALGSEEHLLTVVHAATIVPEGTFRGLPLHEVIVATQQFLRLPVPPARQREDRQVLFLDCRFVLQSFLWLLLEGPYVLVQEIVNLFQPACPPGHIVTVTGAVVHNTPQGVLFHVPESTVLQVTFVEDLLSGVAPSVSLPPDEPGDTSPNDNDDLPDGSGDTGASSSGGRSHDYALVSGARQRSRTPRPFHLAVLGHQQDSTSPFTGFVIGNSQHPDNMWFTGFLQDALAESPQFITPISLFTELQYNSGDAQFQICLSSSSLWNQLTRELHLLAQATRRLRRVSSIFSLEGFSHLTEPTVTVDAAPSYSSSSSALDQLQINASFVLLTPDYTHEALTLEFLVPQPLQEVMDLIEVCRDATRKSLFPRLVPVNPQPDICWGALLALPAWSDRTVIVCINTFALQGTLFAAAAPPIADRYSLLMLAHLPLSTAVNIYRPHSSFPLPDGEELTLHTGDCITFCPPGISPDPALTLEDMVQTHLPWSTGQPFPAPPDDRRYCIVSDHGYDSFQLLPERSTSYKTDLAQRLHLRPSLLSLQPARPPVDDAAFCGWDCITVIAAGESHRQDSHDLEQAGLLDCRPLLSGWHRLVTRKGWVYLDPIKAALSFHTPPGWTVHISGCLPHWTWTWLSPGQVLTASFVSDNDDGSLPSASATGVAASTPACVQDPDPDPATLISRHSEVQPHRQPLSITVRATRSVDSHSSCHGGPLRAMLCAVMLAQTRGTGLQQSNLQAGEEVFPQPPVTSQFADRTLLDQALRPNTHLSQPVAATAVQPPPVVYGQLQDSLPSDAATSSACVNTHADSQHPGHPQAQEIPPSPAPPTPEGEATAAQDTTAVMYTRASFVLLAPEYTPDRLELRLTLPQSLQAVLSALDSCRRADLRQAFPALCAVSPQPCGSCGCILLVPAWPTERVIVCLDLTRFDNRLFATHTLPCVHKPDLLNLAGFANTASVDVYVANQPAPVAHGEEVWLTTGMRITFLAPDAHLEPPRFLADMLCACLTGNPSFTLPGAPSEDRYCVVGEGFYCHFLVLPERAFLYRADIAARFQVPLPQLALSPAVPATTDVCLYGRACRNTVSVTTVTAPVEEDNVTVLFFDCRPILEGWRRVVTAQGWINLQSFHAAFMQGMPPGFHVHFTNCIPPWTWQRFPTGHVIRVFYRPGPDDTCVGSHIGTGLLIQDGSPAAFASYTNDAGAAFPARNSPFAHPAPQHRALTHRQLQRVSSAPFVYDLSVSAQRKPPLLVCCVGPHVLPFAVRFIANLQADTVPMCAAGFTGSVPSYRDSRWDTPAHSTGQDRCFSCFGSEQTTLLKQHRLLQEPVDSVSSHWGPVAQVRAVAQALGQPWPYHAPHGPFEPVTDALHPEHTLDVTGASLSVCILTPGHSREVATITTHPADTIYSLITAIREVREEAQGRLYPFVELPSAQHSLQWLLAIAFPSWAVVDCSL
ncbi:hypothetical protein AK812_SmicGene27741 [Symbiodinium microadriaticum]|uniref:Uncharacterized protein n=1 Tax=Symbiodinium microadriaticum TaxID=2951 RepID=A0A1Q9D6D2_SYMMI|nr:hypothetical protein AK812_SmicGene27741 [Symbiodinium microadriaticum]CAE7843773.1 unnamed protein product [Symbiodinium microadriaticum]CAE7866368.1 unnamed protein product [Symbiodinium sp. KB8]